LESALIGSIGEPGVPKFFTAILVDN